MNPKKLAAAFRELSRTIDTEARRALLDAAAACEEEGERDKRIADALARLESRSYEANDRIAALEAAVKASSALLAAVEARTTHLAPPPAPEPVQMEGFPWEPPAAPEERCAYCNVPIRQSSPCAYPGCGDAEHNHNHHDLALRSVENAFSHEYRPAPPEQAQETLDSPNFVPPEVAEIASRLFKRINRHAPPEQTPVEGVSSGTPEQARRTWTLHVEKDGRDSVCRGIFTPGGACTIRRQDGVPHVDAVQLRPGERIVSGEGVRVHMWHGDIYQCGTGEDPELECREAELHGTFYPERTSGAPEAEGRNAPPRAEEKE